MGCIPAAGSPGAPACTGVAAALWYYFAEGRIAALRLLFCYAKAQQDGHGPPLTDAALRFNRVYQMAYEALCPCPRRLGRLTTPPAVIIKFKEKHYGLD